MGQTSVDLTPGSSVELTFTVLGPPNTSHSTGEVTPTLTLAPGVTPWVSSVEPYKPCRMAG